MSNSWYIGCNQASRFVCERIPADRNYSSAVGSHGHILFWGREVFNLWRPRKL